MAWFTVETTYTDDRAALAAARPRHREYLGRMVDDGVVTAAGPWTDDSAGFVVYRVADRAQLDRLLDADPYTTENVARHRTIHEWNLLFGEWAQ